MHIRIDQRLILVFSLLSITSSESLSDETSENSGNLDYGSRAFLVGYGFSSDLEQITNQPCFNVTVGKISDPTTRIELTKAVSTSELQRTFGAGLSAGGGYGMFSADAKADYLRSSQEDETSISLNYYVVVQEKVTININGEYDEALSDFGKKTYNTEKKYKYFGVVCGDSYISSYTQGAVLFMGLNIMLNSKEEKEKLEGSVGANIGSFAKVTAKIQSASNGKKISGTVQIRAHQFGGNSIELTSIMGKNIANCDIKDMEACKKVVGELISYAKKFGEQMQNGTSLKALVTFGYTPIHYLGLAAPNSTVSSEVLQHRKDLEAKLKENQYYARKLLPLANKKYSVKLKDKMIEHFNKLLANAKNNIDSIMNSETGAVRCFKTPDKCEKIKSQIFNKLKKITSNDLTFLNNIKYYFSMPLDDSNKYLIYNTGEDIKTWVLCDNPISEQCYKYETVKMVKFQVTETYFEYELKTDSYHLHFRGSWVFLSQEYQGVLSSFENNKWTELIGNYVQPLYVSPFFFEEYNSAMDDA